MLSKSYTKLSCVVFISLSCVLKERQGYNDNDNVTTTREWWVGINYTIKLIIYIGFGLVLFMVVKTTFNNISVISVEETRVPGENHWLIAGHWQTLSHNVVSSAPPHERDSYSQL